MERLHLVAARHLRDGGSYWAGETTAHPREVIEHALAHGLKDKAEAAYARGTLFEKGRRMAADWAHSRNTVLSTATVTPIRQHTL